jgi:hypothetical protein
MEYVFCATNYIGSTSCLPKLVCKSVFSQFFRKLFGGKIACDIRQVRNCSGIRAVITSALQEMCSAVVQHELDGRMSAAGSYLVIGCSVA